MGNMQVVTLTNIPMGGPVYWLKNGANIPIDILILEWKCPCPYKNETLKMVVDVDCDGKNKKLMERCDDYWEISSHIGKRFYRKYYGEG